MKYISFVIPSYNASPYLDKVMGTLLHGKDDVEIIIVNDGSKDNTLEIARKYEEQYPSIVRVVDKENGGHGSTINAGLKIATGIYFKVVDADDWVNENALDVLIETIKKHIQAKIEPDMYLTNFVYENISLGKQVVSSHANRFPAGEVCGWDKVKKFSEGEYLMMHNFVFKLSVLKESKIVLPEHTFYVDNLYMFVPLKYVHTLCYLDIDLYRYYVGRPNQSVTLENMTKNWKMQLKVIKEMSLWYTYEDLKCLPRKQYRFMIHDLVTDQYLTLFYIAAGLNKEKKQAYLEFRKEFKAKNKRLYNKLRWRTSIFFPFLLIPPIRRWAVMTGYKIICKKTNWN